MPHKTVLLLGRTGIVVDDVRTHISVSDVNLLAGTSLDDVRAAFDNNRIDVVIMGAGIDLDTRLSIIEHIFNTSTYTTVHMKDWDSGPAGMLPFVDSVLNGLIGTA
ncbi:MAG: hypothetical protein JKY99_03430 [Rhizobiales bacterium]|nr:hypothetical protein [Hyphomicrobiales bacterium]